VKGCRTETRGGTDKEEGKTRSRRSGLENDLIWSETGKAWSAALQRWPTTTGGAVIDLRRRWRGHIPGERDVARLPR